METLDASYDQWLQAVDAQVDLDEMLTELELTPMKWYDYYHKEIIELDEKAVTIRGIHNTENYPIPSKHHRQQLIHTNNLLYRTVRKPGRRPNWLKQLEAATDGQVKIQAFHGQTLAKGKDMWNATRSGITDIGWICHGYFPGLTPVTDVISLPALSSG